MFVKREPTLGGGFPRKVDIEAKEGEMKDFNPKDENSLWGKDGEDEVEVVLFWGV